MEVRGEVSESVLWAELLHIDLTCSLLHHPYSVISLDSLEVYLVCEAEVTATCLQQQTNNVCVSMFAGAHQGGGALAVLGIYVRAAA